MIDYQEELNLPVKCKACKKESILNVACCFLCRDCTIAEVARQKTPWYSWRKLRLVTYSLIPYFLIPLIIGLKAGLNYELIYILGFFWGVNLNTLLELLP